MVVRLGVRAGVGDDWVVRMMEGREQWDRCVGGGSEGCHVRSRKRLIGMAVLA